MARRVLLILVLCAACTGAVAGAHPLKQAPSCPILPPDNAFNQRVDQLPVAPGSTTMVRSIGIGAAAKADFGSGTYHGEPIGIPYKVVSGRQKRVPVSFDIPDESDPGPYPLPANAPIEGGSKSNGDRHVIVVDRDRCRDYELYDVDRLDGGARWRAGSGAVFDLRSNRLRHEGWTSADAAGLPILPGLARYGEVADGDIDHALRFTAPRTRRAYIYPARHYASHSTDATLPPMGLRIRLKRSAKLSRLGPQALVIAHALQRYGALLADNGSPWFFSGAPDSRWDNDDLQTLRQLKGSDFEVVDASSLRPH